MPTGCWICIGVVTFVLAVMIIACCYVYRQVVSDCDGS